ncbi:hypothetical protein VTJ49DRAFT_3005 [Mycothermus thermophilus]|uniref:Uncharacterized protein n=1 Tax=Humicola insolens TaxID=85995 RepID=A0ABR3V9R7_HUMIN
MPSGEPVVRGDIDRTLMKPGVSTSPAVAGVGPVHLRSPDEVTAPHVSTRRASHFTVRPKLWDGAVRRFSEQASHENQQSLAQHVDIAKTACARAFMAIQKHLKAVDATADLRATSQGDVERTAMDLLDGTLLEDRGRVSAFIDILHHYHVRPFEEKFGRAMDRIRYLQECIEKDVRLLHCLETASIVQHQIDAYLHRSHVQAALTAATPNPHPLDPGPRAPLPNVLEAVRFFSVLHTHKSRTIMRRSPPHTALGLCDAPDYQHALQWAAQQRNLSPRLPSAYVIWAQGMTARAAIASLIFQVLQQRPDAALEQGLLDPHGSLARALAMDTSGGVEALWSVFTHMMRALGGCLVRCAIGTAHPSGSRSSIHLGPIFAGDEDAIDLDGLYNVHPSLTTTDALHHMLMLELEVHENHVEDAIRDVLWEAVWREIRYASIGVSMTLINEAIKRAAEDVADEHESGNGGTGATSLEQEQENKEAVMTWWIGARHLDVVDLALLRTHREAIAACLQKLLETIDQHEAGEFASQSLTEAQRHVVWGRMREVIAPVAKSMFCSAIRDLLAREFCTFLEAPCLNARQARNAVMKMLNNAFLHTEAWRSSWSQDGEPVARAISEAIVIGFARTIAALKETAETMDKSRL